jgi:hypothetical protein
LVLTGCIRDRRLFSRSENRIGLAVTDAYAFRGFPFLHTISEFQGKCQKRQLAWLQDGPIGIFLQLPIGDISPDKCGVKGHEISGSVFSYIQLNLDIPDTKNLYGRDRKKSVIKRVPV